MDGGREISCFCYLHWGNHDGGLDDQERLTPPRARLWSGVAATKTAVVRTVMKLRNCILFVVRTSDGGWYE